MNRDTAFWAAVAAVWCGAVVWGTGKAQEAITLDTSRSVGPTVTYTLPGGASCSETSRDRPSQWAGVSVRRVEDAKTSPGLLGGGGGDAAAATIVNSTIVDAVAGSSVGVGVHLPFGGPPAGSCRGFRQLAELEVLAAVVERLKTAGSITAEDARRILFVRTTTIRTRLGLGPGGRR